LLSALYRHHNLPTVHSSWRRSCCSWCNTESRNNTLLVHMSPQLVHADISCCRHDQLVATGTSYRIRQRYPGCPAQPAADRGEDRLHRLLLGRVAAIVVQASPKYINTVTIVKRS
jgi:hypothetical protein